MDLPHLVSAFRDRPPAAQVEALLRLAYELTLVGRASYEGASGQAADRLRAVNEAQHRVVSHALAILTADPRRYPDDVLLAILLEQDDAELRRQVADALARCVTSPTAA